MANLEIIRELSKAKKITLLELAEQADINESTLHSLIRRGSTNTSTLERIAKVLGVSPAIFYPSVGENPLSSEASSAEATIASLRALLDEKDKVIEEKERTIQILMKNLG